jgi:hypothetical protein
MDDALASTHPPLLSSLLVLHWSLDGVGVGVGPMKSRDASGWSRSLEASKRKNLRYPWVKIN